MFINSWAHPDSTCMDLALIIIPNTLRTKLIELHPDWPLVVTGKTLLESIAKALKIELTSEP